MDLTATFFNSIFEFCVFLFAFYLIFFSPTTPHLLHLTKTLNPSSILPSSMPSYSIRLHGPLLFPLPRPRLKEKRQRRNI